MKRIAFTLVIAFNLLTAHDLKAQPTISLSTDSIYFEINEGDSVHLPLTISNTGSEDLFLEIGFEGIGNNIVTFSKPDSANWMLEQYQDRISDSVWITRADRQGIFNIAVEESFDYNSPANTEWAFGFTKDLLPEDYTSWVSAVNGSPPQMVGRPISMHLIREDIYLDLLFHQWTSGARGGGFAYTRMPALRWLWLSEYPDTIPDNSSEQLMIIIDAANLQAGTYQKVLQISSNDPQQPETRLPVHIKVNEAPGIRVSKDTLQYGIVFLGEKDTLELTASNAGSQDLLVSAITIDNDAFEVTPSFAGIDPGESKLFRIIFEPSEEIEYEGNLVFNTNDPTDTHYTVRLKGIGAEPPVITVEPDSIYVELDAGDSTTVDITIGNTGESILNYEIFFAPIGSGESASSLFWNLLGTDPKESESGSFDFDIKNVFGAVSEDKIWIKAESYNTINSEFNYYNHEVFLDIDQDSETGVDLSEYYDIELGVEYGLTEEELYGNENGEFIYLGDYIDYEYIENSHELIINFPKEFVGESRAINMAVNVDGDWIPDEETSSQQILEFPLVSPWLSTSMSEGEIEKGTNRTVPIMFNAKNLFDGDYKAKIMVFSNDPVHPVMDIIAALHVNGVAAYSGPGNVELGAVFAGYSDSASINFENNGTADLVLKDFQFDGSGLSINIDSLTISPKSADAMKIFITADQAGEFSDTLRLKTNDPAVSEVAIPIVAVIYDAPELSLSLDDITASVVGTGSTNESFTVSNEGGFYLNYDITYLHRTSILSFGELSSQVYIPMFYNEAPAEAITVSMWVNLLENLDCDNQNNWRILFSKSIAFSGGTGFDVVVEEFGNLTWSLGLENGLLRYYGGAIPLKEWTHLSFTYDAEVGEANIYVNGKRINGEYWNYANGNIRPNYADFVLNAFSEGCVEGYGHFPGYIQEVQMWDRALTEEEISNSMYYVPDGTEENLVGYWPLDEGSGYEIFDNGSNHMDGYYYDDTGEDVEWLQSDYFSWFTVNPVYGHLATGDPVTIDLTFDALDLDLGVYESGLVIKSNDPEQPLKAVPVTFTIDEESVGLANDAVSSGIRSYPNPFRSETLLEFSLKEESTVVIKIFNTQGQEIRTLADETRQGGIHRISWDGNYSDGLEAESGVYYCRMQITGASNEKVSKHIKLLLMR